jgi:hypothetical protein
MSYLKTSTYLMLVILTSGCIPSLYPLYTDNDVIFNPALVGIWTSKDQTKSWNFQKSSDNSYKLIYTENQDSDVLQAHLVKLGGHLFLDTYPDELRGDHTGFYKGHFVPAHQFFKVELNGDTLKLAYLNFDYLSKQKVQLKHETIGKKNVLTAQPADLQKFVVKFADDPKAFLNDNPGKLFRLSEKNGCSGKPAF